MSTEKGQDDMTEDPSRWQESWSPIYQALAAVAVPDRAEQIATLLSLIPFGTDEPFRVIEAGCGEGYLSQAILIAFPQAQVLALDGSELMRETTTQRLAAFKGRFGVDEFDLFDDTWVERTEGVDVVLSSLAVHHLDDAQKWQLFEHIGQRLSQRGALLIADLIDPGHRQVNQYFGDTWERSAATQSDEIVGNTAPYDLFRKEEWNLFRFPDPDVDKPSRLIDQLNWLKQAGFAVADCFWLQAGHAIYGGFMSDEEVTNPVRFEPALIIAQQVLGDQQRGQRGG